MSRYTVDYVTGRDGPGSPLSGYIKVMEQTMAAKIFRIHASNGEDFDVTPEEILERGIVHDNPQARALINLFSAGAIDARQLHEALELHHHNIDVIG